MPLSCEQTASVLSDFARAPGDTGSSEVQVALWTHRIRSLTEHLKQNPKDHASRQGLLAMVNARRSMLAYLKRKRLDVYTALIQKLGLRG
jgi:small subunit ribosomal protein S15